MEFDQAGLAAVYGEVFLGHGVLGLEGADDLGERDFGVADELDVVHVDLVQLSRTVGTSLMKRLAMLRELVSILGMCLTMRYLWLRQIARKSVSLMTLSQSY